MSELLSSLVRLIERRVPANQFLAISTDTAQAVVNQFDAEGGIDGIRNSPHRHIRDRYYPYPTGEAVMCRIKVGDTWFMVKRPRITAEKDVYFSEQQAGQDLLLAHEVTNFAPAVKACALTAYLVQRWLGPDHEINREEGNQYLRRYGLEGGNIWGNAIVVKGYGPIFFDFSTIKELTGPR